MYKIFHLLYFYLYFCCFGFNLLVGVVLMVWQVGGGWDWGWENFGMLGEGLNCCVFGVFFIGFLEFR